DLAVAACGSDLAYAEALAAMEEHRSKAVLALAASGGRLLNRIKRVLRGSPVHSGANRPAVSGLALLGLAATLVIGSLVGGGPRRRDRRRRREVRGNLEGRRDPGQARRRGGPAAGRRGGGLALAPGPALSRRGQRRAGALRAAGRPGGHLRRSHRRHGPGLEA